MSVKLGLDVELHQLSLMAPAGYSIGLHIRFTAPLFMFQSYDQAWLDHYTEHGYVLRDPMVAWGFSTTGTIRWSDRSLPDPFGLFKEAARFCLHYGATVACGPIKSRTIASFARQDREFTDHEIAAVAQIVERVQPGYYESRGLTNPLATPAASAAATASPEASQDRPAAR